jgi:3-methyladenine DNA glycosylase/8-oxoguanine DNA glycosylase
MARVSLPTAIEQVRKRDRVLDRLVATIGPVKHRPRSADGPFGMLARAIVFQQLAGNVAQIILDRVVAAVGGELSAKAISRTSDAKLRGAGLSANKLASLRDLSAKVLDGSVDLRPQQSASDDEVIAHLTTVRGIGRWTAEMFLMFELRRLDVWPVDDFGVRQGYGLAWGIDPAPTAKVLAPLGDRFRPYRSIVARYCWAAVHRQREGDRAERVYAIVRAIPKGTVRTYGDIDPRAPRLVGRLLSNCPADVPWHRVVRADGRAPQGRRQLERLRKEKVPLRGDRVDMRLARA